MLKGGNEIGIDLGNGGALNVVVCVRWRLQRLVMSETGSHVEGLFIFHVKCYIRSEQ
jgi:hypothetical protein